MNKSPCIIRNKKAFTIFVLLCIFVAATIMSFQGNIKNDEQEFSLQNKNILLYVKENCIYCRLAKEFLENKSLQYEIVNLSNNYDLHKKLLDKTGQTTVPYIFVDDKFIGGYSELKNYK